MSPVPTESETVFADEQSPCSNKKYPDFIVERTPELPDKRKHGAPVRFPTVSE